MNESNFLPMSGAMPRSDAVLSHRELLELHFNPRQVIDTCEWSVRPGVVVPPPRHLNRGAGALTGLQTAEILDTFEYSMRPSEAAPAAQDSQDRMDHQSTR